MMRASDWEFRQRFWIFGVIFWAGFTCYMLDPVNVGWVLARALHRHAALSQAAAEHLVFSAGAMLAVSGAAIRTWATSYLQSHVVHDQALHSERLVADGPYRYVRNPLYLGVVLLGIGLGLMASRLGAVVMLGLLLLYSYRLIFREERELLATQGESYREYLKRVPRLLPSPWPLVPEGGGVSRWGQAFFGEGFFWIFALASVSFAITLKFRFWYIPMLIAAPFYLLANLLLRRRDNAGQAGSK